MWDGSSETEMCRRIKAGEHGGKLNVWWERYIQDDLKAKMFCLHVTLVHQSGLETMALSEKQQERVLL